jgi:hypothetical protein
MNQIKTVLTAALVLTFGLPLVLQGKTIKRDLRQSCGQEETHLAIAVAKHELFERQRARERQEVPFAAASATEAAGPVVEKVGNVAIVDDDGTLVSDANPMDLDNRGIQFKRKKSGVATSSFGGGIGASRGEMITIGDDDSVEVDLAFSFRYFGKRYRKVFINSDGNLTFNTGDSESTERSLARFLNGPPRIAPFFDDLDPSTATGEAGVYVDNRDDLLRVTWFEVSEWVDPNSNALANSNTFQVTLFKNGRVAVAFGDLDAQEGIVGVSPGGSDLLDLLDLSEEPPLARRDNAIAERFGLTVQIDDFGVARTFLDTFRDDYDILLMFADFDVDLGDAFAYSLTLRNDVSGIGRDLYDATVLVGGANSFQTFVQMGDLSRYPALPTQEFLGPDTALSLIGHEAGHRFLAFVNFLDPNGKQADALLGRQRAHWSYFHDSDASVMEGNDIQDNGDGSFTTVAASERYSKLDQYLMGLISAEDVPEFFYVVGENSSAARESNPRVGDTFTGTRVDVSIDDVIAIEGPRNPDWTTAPKTLKTAFLVLGRRNQPVTGAAKAKVRKYRKQWQSFFREATDGSGKVKTKLKRKKTQSEEAS